MVTTAHPLDACCHDTAKHHVEEGELKFRPLLTRDDEWLVSKT